MKKNKYKIGVNIAFVAILFLLHLPFLTADPDTLVDKNTRGAFTDEGLYASQSRNYINTGVLSLTENTTFIRGPLQTLTYIPLLKIFGERLIVLRLLTLLIVVLSLYMLFRITEFRNFLFFAIPVVYFQFHIFHFSHYAMAEMICISMMVLCLYYFIKYVYCGKHKYIFIASVFPFVAYCFKIQYIYFAFILPISVLALNVSLYFNPTTRKKALKELMVFTSYAFTFIAIYILIWYLPNKDFYTYVLNAETKGRMVFSLSHLGEIIYNTYYNHIGIKETKVFRYIFIVSVLTIPFLVNKLTKTEKAFLIFFSAWLLLESHKLIMPNYLPVRYLLSTIMAMGFIVSFVFSKMFNKPILKYLSLSLAAVLIAVNTYHYSASVKRKTYDLQTANNIINNQNLKGKTILGGWAPSLCWGSGAKTLHIWHAYFNYENIIETHKPHVIISELDESDSRMAYASQGINLYEISDSINYINIWKYNLGIYWINSKIIETDERINLY